MAANYFKGKKVFVTGGSSGIGKAIAKDVLLFGGSVVIAARRANVLIEAENELKEFVKDGQSVGHIVLDIANEEAVNKAAPAILEMLGGLDVLVNNAGIAHVGYLQDEKMDNYRSMMEVNYFGSVHVTRAFLPHFMEQKSGNIGFVSSVLGLMGLFGYSAYAASKFAVCGYAECLRMDLLKYNIGVNVCYPPDTDTPQHTEELKSMPAETAAVAGQIKMLQPGDVSREFLDGIARNRYDTTPSFNNKLTMWAVRHMPGISRFFIDRDIRSASTPKK